MIWYFIGVYLIGTLNDHLKIRNFSSHGEEYLTCLVCSRLLKYFSTLKEKFHISVCKLCNIFFLLMLFFQGYQKWKLDKDFEVESK